MYATKFLKKSSSQLHALKPPDPFEKRKREKPFFEKILMDQQAPRTYQHFHNKKVKPHYRYHDAEQSASLIQKAWRRFKCMGLLRKIQLLEQPINAYNVGRTSRLPDPTSTHQRFSSLVIERLMWDLTISNRIIQKLENEYKQVQAEGTRQNEEVKSVLQEYLQFIDVTLQQKYELEQEVIRLQESTQSQQVPTECQLCGVKENIFLMSNKLDNLQTGQEGLKQTLSSLLKQKEEEIHLKDQEMLTMRSDFDEQIQALNEQLRTQLTFKDREIKALNTQIENLSARNDQSTFDESDRSLYLQVERELREIQTSYQISLQKLADL